MSLDTAPKLSRRRVFGFALETATGTPVTPTGSDAVTRVFDPDLRYSTEIVEREEMGNGTPIIQFMGARSATASFETELVGNGTTGLPIWTRLLQGCGWTLGTGGV